MVKITVNSVSILLRIAFNKLFHTKKNIIFDTYNFIL